MKRVILMITVSLFPRLMVAQDFSIDSLVGDNWYGVYLNGEKAGFALNSLKKDEQGQCIYIEDAQFRVNMAGVKQDIHIFSKRTYAPQGALVSIESKVVDQKGESEFNAHVEGEGLTLVSITAGTKTEEKLPRPLESLSDAVKHARWVHEKPHLGDVLEFTTFEPMYKQEVEGVSHLVGIEDRVLDGIVSKVYKIKTTMEALGIESISTVAENGTTLEDVIAGSITMRIEPEERAKDVDYKNDVIVSNAVILKEPLEKPRERETLHLLLRGPLSSEHLFSDDRQAFSAKGDAFEFTARKITLEGFTPAQLPIQEESVKPWIKPTVFVQSEDSRLIEKAKEIVGGETNTLTISNKVCAWVNDNMHSTFSARLTNALEVLNSLEGDCTEHSILFIGLLRAAGVPAQEVAGLIYVDGVKPGFYFHQWAKVWIGKWIEVDPTFNQPVADVTHIKLAEGDLFKQAKLIPIIGNLKIDVLPDAPAPGTPPAPAPASSAKPPAK